MDISDVRRTLYVFNSSLASLSLFLIISITEPLSAVPNPLSLSELATVSPAVTSELAIVLINVSLTCSLTAVLPYLLSLAQWHFSFDYNSKEFEGA